MSRGTKKWSEEVVAQLQKEGHGEGRVPPYLPWVRVIDFYVTRVHPEAPGD